MEENKVPRLFERKEECCGCMACLEICPKKAITIYRDEEGFDYPMIKREECVKCYCCIRVCPIKKKKALDN